MSKKMTPMSFIENTFSSDISKKICQYIHEMYLTEAHKELVYIQKQIMYKTDENIRAIQQRVQYFATTFRLTINRFTDHNKNTTSTQLVFINHINGHDTSVINNHLEFNDDFMEWQRCHPTLECRDYEDFYNHYGFSKTILPHGFVRVPIMISRLPKWGRWFREVSGKEFRKMCNKYAPGFMGFEIIIGKDRFHENVSEPVYHSF